MWGTVLTLAALEAVDPLRLGIILLLVSRPRPVANLLVYTAGVLTACIYMLVVPLLLLAAVPAPSVQDGTVQLVLGAVALLGAALIIWRRPGKHRGGQDTTQRALARFRNIWDSGKLWVAFVVGVGTGGPTWTTVGLLLAVASVSQPSAAGRWGAVVVVAVGMLAAVEVALAAYLINPGGTQAGLQRLRDWVWAHRRHILAGVSAAAGVSLVVSGLVM